MNKKFVKITLTLSALFVMAFSTQAFAAEECSFDSSSRLNNNLTKISSQLNQNSVKRINDMCQKVFGGNVNRAELQKLLKDCNITISNKVTKQAAPAVPAKPAAPAVPVRPAAPAVPVKPAAPAVPVKPTAPAKPATPVAPVPAEKPAVAVPSASMGNYEQQVADLVNAERAKAGLPALKVNTKLGGVAEKKAEDLRDMNYFSHTSPTYGSPFDMMKQFGITYTAAGENIAKGQKTPDAVMNGWMNSQGHKDNILSSSYTEIGVGYVTDSNGTTYWVQMFIRP